MLFKRGKNIEAVFKIKSTMPDQKIMKIPPFINIILRIKSTSDLKEPAV